MDRRPYTALIAATLLAGTSVLSGCSEPVTADPVATNAGAAAVDLAATGRAAEEEVIWARKRMADFAAETPPESEVACTPAP